MQTAVIDSTLGVAKKIEKRVLDVDDEKFWKTIDVALMALYPLLMCIRILEREGFNLSEALEAMFKIKKSVCEFLSVQADDVMDPNTDSNDFCSLAELQKSNADYENRLQMYFGPIHSAANLVDPRFFGKNLLDLQRLEGYQYLED